MIVAAAILGYLLMASLIGVTLRVISQVKHWDDDNAVIVPVIGGVFWPLVAPFTIFWLSFVGLGKLGDALAERYMNGKIKR